MQYDYPPINTYTTCPRIDVHECVHHQCRIKHATCPREWSICVHLCNSWTLIGVTESPPGRCTFLAFASIPEEWIECADNNNRCFSTLVNSFSSCIAKNEEYSVPCSPSSSPPTTKELGLSAVGGQQTPATAAATGPLNHHLTKGSAATGQGTTHHHHHYYPHFRGSHARSSVAASSSSHHYSGATAAVFFPAYHNMDQNMDYYPTGVSGGGGGGGGMLPVPPPPPPPQPIKKEKSPSLTIDRAAFLLLRVKKAFKRKRQQRKDKQ